MEMSRPAQPAYPTPGSYQNPQHAVPAQMGFTVGYNRPSAPSVVFMQQPVYGGGVSIFYTRRRVGIVGCISACCVISVFVVIFIMFALSFFQLLLVLHLSSLITFSEFLHLLNSSMTTSSLVIKYEYNYKYFSKI